jgi:uncharacterized protein (DUF924 family)
MHAEAVLTFWFDELDEKDWWRQDDGLDRQIEARFLATLHAARRGELFVWRERARGRLAEIIALDQFSRNIFRGSAEVFAADGMALVLAQEAVARGIDHELDLTQRVFLYLPYMHSESLLIHDEALRLFDQPGLEYNFDFEKQHRAILERFGRYPHRNAVLGRESTTAEIEFLKQPGSSF